MSVLELIEKEWGEDSQIEEIDLSAETRKTAKLHNKYHKYYNGACRRLKELESERARLTFLKTDYYLGNLDKDTLQEKGWKPFKRVVIKTDLPLFLAADEEMIALNLKISDQDQVVKFLESIIRSINNRGYHIRNIIDYEKFINGDR